MGLFDIFKKKATQKCSECLRAIDGFVWNLNNKSYCQECYNRHMAIVQQTDGRAPEEYDFEMTIENVFFIKNHGVVVTGKIHRGVIHRNDTVVINGVDYTVTLIDVIPNQVEYAKESADAGLHLSTMNASLFKAGDVVTSKRINDTPPKSSTFVCEVCGKELPIKYRHSRSVCTECRALKPTLKSQPAEDSSNAEFRQGTNKFNEEEYLDDITFIRSMKHIPIGQWHQYNVILDARGYGWDMMKDWADYMAEADLEHISQVTAGDLGVQERDITASYSSSGGKCKNTPELNAEMGMLSIAGISKALKAPMKIVWINQTRVLRFFTWSDDELLVTKYIETMIRRTFGTKNEMKLCKPNHQYHN